MHFQTQVDEKLLYVIMRGILAPHQISQAMKTAVVKKVKGSGDKGNFCRSKTREGQPGVEIFLPCPVLRCGDRHLGVKVEVSIRQRRFVGLIGHPHVFVPIMGLRAEGPAGLRAHRWAQTSADQVARLSQCSAQLCCTPLHFDRC